MSIVTSWPEVLTRSTWRFGAGMPVGAGVAGAGVAGAGGALGEGAEAPTPALHAANVAARAMAPITGTNRDRWLLVIILSGPFRGSATAVVAVCTRDEGPDGSSLHGLGPMSAS
jgi:hypothetical protein